jgi:hypothetical protein
MSWFSVGLDKLKSIANVGTLGSLAAGALSTVPGVSLVNKIVTGVGTVLGSASSAGGRAQTAAQSAAGNLANVAAAVEAQQDAADAGVSSGLGVYTANKVVDSVPGWAWALAAAYGAKKLFVR